MLSLFAAIITGIVVFNFFALFFTAIVQFGQFKIKAIMSKGLLIALSLFVVAVIIGTMFVAISGVLYSYNPEKLMAFF